MGMNPSLIPTRGIKDANTRATGKAKAGNRQLKALLCLIGLDGASPNPRKYVYYLVALCVRFLLDPETVGIKTLRTKAIKAILAESLVATPV